MTMVLDGLEQWGGVPVGIGYPPFLGDTYFVDGTNGDDTHGGKAKNEAKQTIQAALTLQIAKTTGLGDRILVLPGTYAESLTGDMTKVEMIGVGRVGERPMARIHPTTAAAYTGDFVDSGFKNLEFLTPSTPSSNVTSAIVFTTDTSTLMNMQNSYVDYCFFSGGSDHTTYNTYGIILGNETVGNTTWEFSEFSRIRGNTFTSVGGRTKQLSVAICCGGGYPTTQGGAEYKGMTGVEISYNRINAHLVGINCAYGATGGTGSTIFENIIGSAEDAWGCQLYGVRFESAAADQLTKVYHNWITSNGTAISNCSQTGYALDNWISSLGTEAHLYPAAT